MMRLSHLNVEGLRGIPLGWPGVAIGEAGLVLYGPNGSGKSSIIDGIEAALGIDSTLYPEKRQGVNWDRGSQHIKGGPKRAELIASISGSDVNVTTLSGAPDEVADWKRSCAESVFVLRRYMLLKFIVSAPADRYNSLEEFFNLRSYEELESKLNSLFNSAKSVESGLEVHHARELQSLRLRLGLSEQDAVTRKLVEENLSKKLEAAGLEAASSPADLATRKQQVTDELSGITADSRFSLLARIRGRVEELVPSSTYDQMLGQLSEFQDAYRKAQEESGKVAPAAFLKTAQNLIEANSLSECPVCEQPIEPVATIASLESRVANDIKTSAALAALQAHRKKTIDEIRDHVTAFKSAISGCLKAFSGDIPTSYSDELKLLDELLKAISDSDLVPNISELRLALKSSISTHQPLLDRITKELAESGGTRRTALTDVLDAFKIVETDMAALNSTQSHLASARKQREVLERLTGHALRARRATVQKIVDRLASLANEFYELIHPGEGIAESALEVRDVGKGSVELSTSFHGTLEHPLLHFSESHLDTLGLCYFLAARRLEADTDPKFKLLVLDDVIHSVDADHRDRIARLLKGKFSDHQIVVVTHDSIFYQRLRAIFGSKYEYVYFTNWSVDGGPVRIQASTDIDRITSAELRDSMSQDELASACGRFAEWLFMQLDERLQVAIQARFTRAHDLGSLWPPLASKLKKQKGFEANKEIIENIDASQWVRNKVGAHYNEPESPVTPGEVRELAKALSDLYEATFCSTCGTTIGKIDDKKWQCACGALTYQPDEAPTV